MVVQTMAVTERHQSKKEQILHSGEYLFAVHCIPGGDQLPHLLQLTLDFPWCHSHYHSPEWSICSFFDWCLSVSWIFSLYSLAWSITQALPWIMTAEWNENFHIRVFFASRVQLCICWIYISFEIPIQVLKTAYMPVVPQISVEINVEAMWNFLMNMPVRKPLSSALN